MQHSWIQGKVQTRKAYRPTISVTDKWFPVFSLVCQLLSYHRVPLSKWTSSICSFTLAPRLEALVLSLTHWECKMPISKFQEFRNRWEKTLYKHVLSWLRMLFWNQSLNVPEATRNSSVVNTWEGSVPPESCLRQLLIVVDVITNSFPFFLA